MTLLEQCAVLIEAGEARLLQVGDVVQWADKLIVALDKPPPWIIELSTLHSNHVADYLLLLRQQTSVQLSPRQRIQLLIHAYQLNRLSLDELLQKCFEIIILEENKNLLTESENRLADLLVEWDCNDLIINQDLKSRFEEQFSEYMSGAEETTFLLQKLMSG